MERVKVCHIVSGDLWAGKEAVCAVLVRGLVKHTDIEVSAIVFNEGRLQREILESGVRTDLIDERTHGSFSLLRRMKEILRDTRPDVVHAHGYKEHILGAWAARCVGARVVRTLHGMPEPHPLKESIRSWVYGRIEWFTIRRMTDVVVAVSKEMQGTLEGKTGRAKLVQIYNGIESERLPKEFDRAGFRRELGLPEEAALIGAVGRLVPVKGLNYLIEAAAMLRSDHLEFRWVIVGDGPCRPDLERQARESGIADRVHFLGHRDDVHSILGCLDVLAMPSLHEGIPMGLLEARAVGVPVVASNVGGIPEIVASSARLITPGDSAALAEGIRFQVQQRAQSEPDPMPNDFSAAKMTQRYLSLYRHLVENERSGG